MEVLGSLWLSHWHCIVPAILIAVVLLVRNQSKKNQPTPPQSSNLRFGGVWLFW